MPENSYDIVFNIATKLGRVLGPDYSIGDKPFTDIANLFGLKDGTIIIYLYSRDAKHRSLLENAMKEVGLEYDVLPPNSFLVYPRNEDSLSQFELDEMLKLRGRLGR